MSVVNFCYTFLKIKRNYICYDEQGIMCWQISNKLPSNIVSKEQIPYIAIQVIFADMDMFEQDCMRNVRIMKRLTSVVLKNRLKLFFDNYDKVPEIVKENNLKIDFDAEGKIVYKDKTELYRITNLMADSYFRSLLLDRLGVAKLEGNMEE